MLQENQNMELVLIEDLGMKYPTEKSNYKKGMGIYKCFCGNEFKSVKSDIKRGNTKSCGCIRGKFKSKYVRTTKNKIFTMYRNAISRCTYKKNKRYDDYGGRGISVCNEWLNSYENFFDWCVDNGFKDGLSIDRINNDGNYEPNNCRFVTMLVQSQNNRLLRATNKSGYRGVHFHKCAKKWLASICINYNIIRIGYYESAIEAAYNRDKYIIENKLLHKLNF